MNLAMLRKSGFLLLAAFALTGCPGGGPGSDTSISNETRSAKADLRADGTIPIGTIQGRSHRSPWAGRDARVRGVVTGVEAPRGERRGGFWIQDEGDGDDATADGLFVFAAPGDPPTMGQRVEIAGTIEERDGGGLTVTAIEAFEVTPLGDDPSPNELPAAIRLGAGGRAIPDGIVDDDGLRDFQPESDAVDFFESLEGMRVEIETAHVVGPTDRFGTVTVVPDVYATDRLRTAQGGLVVDADWPYAGRLHLAPSLLDQRMPALDVGARFLAPVVGVLGYDYGLYRILPSSLPNAVETRFGLDGPTTLRGGDDALTVATFNVHNLAGNADASDFDQLAEVIVADLGAPDLLCLQEIQDDDGPERGRTASAAKTLDRLTAAIRRAGGPAYEVRQIDPAGADGGQPDANIRVVFLYDPSRLEALDQSPAGASRQDLRAQLARRGDGWRLEPSPALLLDPAFDKRPGDRLDDPGAWAGTRKPLVAAFRFADRDLLAIGLHLRSKGADDRPFGPAQPPVLHSESQRTAQAQVVADFVDEVLAHDENAAILVLGDFNEHAFAPPLGALADAGLVPLLELLPPEDRSTFNFQGISQTLDHILVSPVLARAGPAVDVVHRNAWRAASRQASDHDPIVARLPMP